MNPWNWDDERNLWINGTTDETMTASEYDDARCKQIAKLEFENARLSNWSDILRHGRRAAFVLCPKTLIEGSKR